MSNQARNTHRQSVHPSRPRQTLARYEVLLSRGLERVGQGRWRSALFFLRRAIASNPDECTRAISVVSIAGCEAAIEAEEAIAVASVEEIEALPTPRDEYVRILRERSKEIPDHCLA